MAEVIKLSSNIKKYAVVNENDEVVAEIKLDISDSGFFSRFLDAYDNLIALVDETTKSLDELKDEEATIENSKELFDINKAATLKVIGEIDNLFGRNFVKGMLKEHYEINEDYIPDTAILIQFFEQIAPIIKKAYKASTKNYTVKKGKK